MNISTIKEGTRLIKQGIAMLDGGPLDYYLDRLTGCYEFLLTLAPFQPGARVKLRATPVITERENSGWLGFKHFLIEGAEGTVRAVHADRDGFSYEVEFDDDSWIDSHTQQIHLRPPGERGWFHFAPHWLMS